MKQRNAIALCFLCVISCATNRTPGPDSETSWLTCNKVEDCESDKAVACVERYCVDVNGERISATDVGRVDATTDASEPDGLTALQIEGGMNAIIDASEPDGVAALQIEGVWVFEHDPDGFNEALHSGRADIVDGCLLVGDAVVVWHVSRRSDAERAVSEVLSGNHPRIGLGGGGLSLSEGSTLDDFPAAITEHCAVSEVWYAAPTPAEFLTDDSGDSAVALPSCEWPAELVEAGESREVCSAGRALLSCEMPGGLTQICVSDNAVSCPDDSSSSTPSSCTSLCEPDEYVASCGGIGPGPIPDPPEGCDMGFALPAGILMHCCPCL